LARKNPYLFKAKNVETADVLVRQIVDAHLSSHEETVFGDFLELLAIYICSLNYNGRKSTTEGIDLEFERGNTLYVVSIKSGPNWGNSSQVKKMRDLFRQARKIYGATRHLIAVNGCCYGRDSRAEKGDYLKLCGQPFWELVSGEPEMHRQIVDPLGAQAKERNDVFHTEYQKVLNRFTREFLNEFSAPDGSIDWNSLVAFNSSKTSPSRNSRRKSLQ
jgi:Type II restriction endonuclease EcoO109I